MIGSFIGVTLVICLIVFYGLLVPFLYSIYDLSLADKKKLGSRSFSSRG